MGSDGKLQGLVAMFGLALFFVAVACGCIWSISKLRDRCEHSVMLSIVIAFVFLVAGLSALGALVFGACGIKIAGASPGGFQPAVAPLHFVIVNSMLAPAVPATYSCAMPHAAMTLDLDETTAGSLKALAESWGVPPAEAVSRAVRASAESLGHVSGRTSLEVFRKLQQAVGLTAATAAQWKQSVADARR